MSQCAVAAGVAVCAGCRPRGPAERPGKVRVSPYPCKFSFRDQHRGLAEQRGMVRSGPGHVQDQEGQFADREVPPVLAPSSSALLPVIVDQLMQMMSTFVCSLVCTFIVL